MGVPQASQDAVPSPRPPVTDRRRIRKPIMEKKRRDRINSCLDELSSLLAEERLGEGEAGKTIRLEKADILELTVRYWQGVRSTIEQGEEEIESLIAAPEESSYLTGYKQCIRVVDDLLTTCPESGTEALRQGLLQHLSSRVEELTPPPSDTIGSDGKGAKSATPPTSDAAQVNKLPSASPQCLTLVPARLPDGALALLLQEGSDSKHSMKNEDQQTASSSSSSEPDVSSTSSASQRSQIDHERPQQLKATEELLTPLPSTRDDNSTDPTASPPNATTVPSALPTERDNEREVSVPSIKELPGAEEAPHALGGLSEEYLTTTEEVEMKEEEEEEEEEETPMDLCIDRVWRPW